MNCLSCAAPIPSGAVCCAYCGSRADLDLQGWSHAVGSGPWPEHSCPNGHGPLELVELQELRLGRCPTCLGLCLEPGSLETLLRPAAAEVLNTDRRLLDALTKAPRQHEGAVRYRPCAVCGDLMNRSLFGHRSGVIVDRCRDHGVWLDAGELRQLLEWTRAGGALLDQQLHQEEQDQALRAARRAAAAAELQGDAPEGLEVLNPLGRALARWLG
ncbi:zf-TFIIB domain-containing protein [Cyanobium sp. FACHB-13342]|uniref:zf-TFIIB domain-containing protein n=1 Tax=Cyanobium sp. FACHB-13342 TaxID=2692793 RepID=UPI00168026CD|nr:zf-TFIIB domain-containing protein [Cyanobium sp. FACHB-13342]